METVTEETRQDGIENAQKETSSAQNGPTSPIVLVPPPPTPTSNPTPTSKSTPTPTSKPTPTSTSKPTPAPIPASKPISKLTSSVPHTLHSDQPKKSKRAEDRNKEDYVKQFTKAINAASPEEKTQIAIQKYTHMVDDNKKMQFYIKQSEKRHAILMKEKDQLQLEFNKTILVKSKLENLCRELQKQNKSIKEESLMKIREEEERRKETQAKFQNTLTEITALLQQNNEKNSKLRDDNISMTEKFKNVVTQYQLREQQIEKMSKQMTLEQQLADAKMMKASLEHQAERERLLAELEGLKSAARQHHARVQDLQATEAGLRSQLAVYTDKYDEFQSALVKSNKVFGGFKEEMEKMTKKIKKLEKESYSWQKRWETSQTALLDMCGERQASEERAASVARQLQNMQSLCRTLQAERTLLLCALKENNIERPPLPAPVPAPPPPPPPAQPGNSKVDAMAANCAQLRQSLAHLQNQLNVLTTTPQPATPEEPPKPEKSKKSKSKKSKKQEAPKESESDSNARESANESANEERAATVESVDTASGETADKTQAVDDCVKDVDANVNAVTDKEENAAGGVEAIEDKADNAITDDKTIESLIQAINNANINLCDLEVVEDDKIDIDDVLDVDSLSKEDEATKSTDTASAEASELETSNKDSSNEDSPTNGPKIAEVVEEISNGVEVLVTERLDNGDDGGNISELTDEIENGRNLVELTDEIANRPKIIELPDDFVSSMEVIYSENCNIGIPKEVKQLANSEIKAKVIGEMKSAAQVKDA